MPRRNKNGTPHDDHKPKPISSKRIIRRVCRERWGPFVKPDGALSERAHHDDVFSFVLADPEFVKVRKAEELKLLHDDITAAVRAIRNGTHPTADQIIARGQTGEGGEPIQMSLSLEEFRREQYEVPITGETKAGPDLLVKEGAALLEDHDLKIAIYTVKRNRLAAVMRAARLKRLGEDERLARVWAA
jgi:hypothetical protein